jgi:predicted nucleic acid-binding protein
MAGYLFDTNHLSEAIRKTSALRDRIRAAHRRGHRFATCWPVLCELEAGICQMARAEAHRRTLQHFSVRFASGQLIGRSCGFMESFSKK